jgi:hypothetical protein
MSLNWNVSRCDQNACWKMREDTKEHEMTSTCHALIWSTMVIGMNEMTEANLPEWRYRLTMTARLFKWTNEPEDGFTESFLRPFVGLNSNATTLTRQQFLKKIGAWLDRDLGTDVKRPAVSKTKPMGV